MMSKYREITDISFVSHRYDINIIEKPITKRRYRYIDIGIYRDISDIVTQLPIKKNAVTVCHINKLITNFLPIFQQKISLQKPSFCEQAKVRIRFSKLTQVVSETFWM